MKKRIKRYFYSFIGAFGILLMKDACAALLDTDLGGEITRQELALKDRAGFDTGTTIGEIASTAISAFLSILGVAFITLIIFAGWNWMTAQGEEQKITKAKDTIRKAIVGLIIIIAAYAITRFVFTRLPGGTSGGGGMPIP